MIAGISRRWRGRCSGRLAPLTRDAVGPRFVDLLLVALRARFGWAAVRRTVLVFLGVAGFVVRARAEVFLRAFLVPAKGLLPAVARPCFETARRTVLLLIFLEGLLNFIATTQTGRQSNPRLGQKTRGGGRLAQPRINGLGAVHRLKSAKIAAYSGLIPDADGVEVMT
jgi:hypothetical protein